MIPRTFRFDKFRFDPAHVLEKSASITSPRPVQGGQHAEIKKYSHGREQAFRPLTRDRYRSPSEEQSRGGEQKVRRRSLWKPGEDPALLNKPLKVLVGIEEGLEGVHALGAALKFVQRYHCHLLLGKVVPHQAETKEYLQDLKKLEEIRAQALRHLAPLYRQKYPPQLLMENNPDPAKGLLQIAGREHVSLIIVGSKPKTPSEMARLGTVSGRVLEGAPCPVLVWRTRKGSQGLKRVMVPVDGTPFSYQAILQAIMICQEFGGGILALHVSPSRETMQSQRLQISGLMEKMDWKGVRYELASEVGPVADSIIRFCARYPIDMAIMGTHGGRGAGQGEKSSITSEVIQRVGCPVLVVQPNI